MPSNGNSKDGDRKSSNESRTKKGYSRRKTLAGGTSLVAMAIAGCLGDDDEGENDVGSGDAITEVAEIDRENPDFPIRSDAFYDASLRYGSAEEFEAMEERDEVQYGPEVPPRHPEDESEVLDIDEITWAWTAGEENPAAYYDDLEPIMELIEEHTGYPVRGVMFDSRPAMVEARRANHLHSGRMGAGQVPYNMDLADVWPMTYGLNEIEVQDEEILASGYKLACFTRIGSGITSVEDYEGREIAFAHDGSFSGNFAPRAFFEQEFGLVAEEDYEVRYAGDHETGYLGLVAGDYDGTASASTSVWRLDGEVDWTETQAVWTSDPFPNGIQGYINRLPEEIKDGYDEAFWTADLRGTTFVEEHGAHAEFNEFDYPTHYHPMLVVHEFLETDFTHLEE